MKNICECGKNMVEVNRGLLPKYGTISICVACTMPENTQGHGEDLLKSFCFSANEIREEFYIINPPKN